MPRQSPLKTLTLDNAYRHAEGERDVIGLLALIYHMGHEDAYFDRDHGLAEQNPFYEGLFRAED